MTRKFPLTRRSLTSDGSLGLVLVLACGAVLLALWGVWAFLARVAVLEASLSARLEVGHAPHPVQADVAARVLRTELVLGRVVGAGDVLVELDARVERLQLEEARARKAGLERQLEALVREVETREQARRHSLTAMETAVEESQARRAEADERATQAQEEADRLARLKAEGHIGEIEYMRALTEAKARASQASALTLASRRAAVETRSRDSEQRATLTQLAKEMASLEAEIGTLSASIQRLEVEIERRTLRAPVAGRLGEVAVLPVGAYVTVGSRLCSIVPEAPVRVVAEFPWSSALGRIEPGQSAQVRLTGFSWVEWGALRGSVLSVATEAPAGAVRVELALADDQVSRAPMEHGLAAEVLVEVERVAPVVLLARAVGKALSPAPAARPPSDGLAGRPP